MESWPLDGELQVLLLKTFENIYFSLTHSRRVHYVAKIKIFREATKSAGGAAASEYSPDTVSHWQDTRHGLFFSSILYMGHPSLMG